MEYISILSIEEYTALKYKEICSSERVVQDELSILTTISRLLSALDKSENEKILLILNTLIVNHSIVSGETFKLFVGLLNSNLIEGDERVRLWILRILVTLCSSNKTWSSFLLRDDLLINVGRCVIENSSNSDIFISLFDLFHILLNSHIFTNEMFDSDFVNNEISELFILVRYTFEHWESLGYNFGKLEYVLEIYKNKFNLNEDFLLNGI